MTDVLEDDESEDSPSRVMKLSQRSDILERLDLMMTEGSTHSPDGVGSDDDSFGIDREDNRDGLNKNLENTFFIMFSWCSLEERVMAVDICSIVDNLEE